MVDNDTNDTGHWRDVGGGTFVKWSQPTMVEGTYMGYTEVTGAFGAEKRHRITTADGDIEFYAPSMLARLLSYITPGDQVQIGYDGKTVMSRAGKPVKQFKVRSRLVTSNGESG